MNCCFLKTCICIDFDGSCLIAFEANNVVCSIAWHVIARDIPVAGLGGAIRGIAKQGKVAHLHTGSRACAAFHVDGGYHATNLWRETKRLFNISGSLPQRLDTRHPKGAGGRLHYLSGWNNDGCVLKVIELQGVLGNASGHQGASTWGGGGGGGRGDIKDQGPASRSDTKNVSWTSAMIPRTYYL